MYHVRVHFTGVERTIYQETYEGLKRAIEEAALRTQVTKVAHEVVDDHGLRLHLALHTPRDTEWFTWSDYLLIGLGLSCVLFALYVR